MRLSCQMHLSFIQKWSLIFAFQVWKFICSGLSPSVLVVPSISSVLPPYSIVGILQLNEGLELEKIIYKRQLFHCQVSFPKGEGSVTIVESPVLTIFCECLGSLAFLFWLVAALLFRVVLYPVFFLLLQRSPFQMSQNEGKSTGNPYMVGLESVGSCSVLPQ